MSYNYCLLLYILRWTTHSPLRIPRCHGSLVESKGVLYLCGGLTPLDMQGIKSTTVSVSALDVYDEKTDSWSALTDLTLPRHQTTAAAMGKYRGP